MLRGWPLVCAHACVRLGVQLALFDESAVQACQQSGLSAVLQSSEAADGRGGGGGGGGAGREIRDGLYPRAAAGSTAEGAPPVMAPQQASASGGALHHRICRQRLQSRVSHAAGI